MSALFQWYSNHLARSPLLTNIVSGSTVLVIGDCLAQTIERNRGVRTSSYDPVRSSVMLSWAVLGDVPINLALFNAVDRAVSLLGIPVRSTLPQSFLKAGLFFVPGAIIRNPCFICFVTPFEHLAYNLRDGRAVTSGWDSCVETIRRKLSEDLFPIVATSAIMWMPVNSLTFWLIPPVFRTIWTSGFTVIWCTYLSMVQHKELTSTSTKQDNRTTTTLATQCISVVSSHNSSPHSSEDII